MAVNKPTRPDSELPETWGGTQYPYTEEEIENGYLETVPQIVDGGKLNYQMKGVFERIKYTTAIADVVNNTPIGQTVAVDSNNRFEYRNLPVISSDDEYSEGVSTVSSPSVKQVADSFLDLNGKITNCITEIPQDIKLELNDGTLTLKAGSKVYVPNGFEDDGTTPKFDEVTIESDVNYSITGSNTFLVCLKLSTGKPEVNFLSNCKSGSDPTGFTYGYFYNTSDNTVYDYRASKNFQASLPFAVVTISDSSSSIDQVFNGFGYIGSTVFALPGVKGLIPDGRNEDGSLKNIEVIVNNVSTTTYNWNSSASSVGLFANGKLGPYYLRADRYYDETLNYNFSEGTPIYIVVPVKFSGSAGVISNFTPKTTFQAVDYNDAVLTYGDQEIDGTKTFKKAPEAPTPATNNNSTQIATTEYFNNVFSPTAITSISSGYVTTRPCCLKVSTVSKRNSWVKVGNIQVFEDVWNENYGDPNVTVIPVGMGQTITFSGLSTAQIFYKS